MTSWRVAWRARRAAFRASLLPFALMLALRAAEDAIQDAWLVLPERVQTAVPDLVVLDALYAALDGLFLALLLEAILSGHRPADSLPPLRPPRRAVLFALAVLPLGLAGSLFSLAVRWGFWNLLAVFVDRVPDPDTPGAFSQALIRSIGLVVTSPALSLVAIGLAVAPVAVRLLDLPRIRDEHGQPPSTAPSLDLFGALLFAVLLDVFLGLVVEGVLGGLPLLGETVLPNLLAWYVANFTALTLVGSAVATMLVRCSGDVRPRR